MAVNLSLEGKVALITGGSRGIGAAAVRMFTAAGAKVMFNYQSARTQADALVAECGEARCAAVACDLTGLDSARDLVDETVKHFGRLDILVANHGVWPPKDAPVDEMSDAAQEFVLDQARRHQQVGRKVIGLEFEVVPPGS